MGAARACALSGRVVALLQAHPMLAQFAKWLSYHRVYG